MKSEAVKDPQTKLTSSGAVVDIPDELKKPTNDPLFISFYFGDKYYYDAGARLQADCEQFGLANHIVEAKLPKGSSWIQICRYKVRFVAQYVRECDRPIVWLDVDSRLLKKPEMLLETHADLAFFLRGFKNLKDFDPAATSRMIAPVVLYYGRTKLAKQFAELIYKLEEEYEGDATDDYFLQEAWKQFDQPMTSLVLSPGLVESEGKSGGREAAGDQYFYIGISGNVSTFKGQAVQHEVELFTPARRKAVLLREATDLGKVKRYKEMLVLLQLALASEPNDEKLVYRTANLLKRLGRLKDAFNLMRDFKGGNPDVNNAGRYILETAMLAGMLRRAEKAALDLIENGSDSDKAYAQSRLMRIQMGLRARRLNLRDEERVAMWWMETPYPGNFGDMVNPYIIEKLTGMPPIFADPKSKALLAVGSIIKFAIEGTPVWGPGTPRMTDHLHPKAKYYAVRGPLTRNLVIQSGGDCPEVYGDPAVLLPKLYKPKTTKKYKLGLITHHIHDGDLTTSKDVKRIHLLRAGYQGIEDFLDELNECEAILSTSLHGLIVAHAYGIPARWCAVTGTDHEISGDGTKFHDYMLSVGLDKEPPLELPTGTVIDLSYAPQANRLPKKPIDLEKLVAAAPFKARPGWQTVGETGQLSVAPRWLRRPYWVSRPFIFKAIKNFDEFYLNGLLRRIYAAIR